MYFNLHASTIYLGMNELTQQLVNEKNKCKLAQGLVRNYGKISDRLNKMLAFLENQKDMHKKQSLGVNHMFNSLEKTAIEKCMFNVNFFIKLYFR